MPPGSPQDGCHEVSQRDSTSLNNVQTVTPSTANRKGESAFAGQRPLTVTGELALEVPPLPSWP